MENVEERGEKAGDGKKEQSEKKGAWRRRVCGKEGSVEGVVTREATWFWSTKASLEMVVFVSTLG